MSEKAGEQFTREMSKFVQSLGLPADTETLDAMSFRIGEDGTLVHLSLNENGDQMNIWSVVADFGQEAPSQAVWTSALEANFLLLFDRGAALGLNRDQNALVLCEALNVQGITAELIETRLAGFVAAAQMMSNRLGAAVPVSGASGSGESGPDDMQNLYIKM